MIQKRNDVVASQGDAWCSMRKNLGVIAAKMGERMSITWCNRWIWAAGLSQSEFGYASGSEEPSAVKTLRADIESIFRSEYLRWVALLPASDLARLHALSLRSHCFDCVARVFRNGKRPARDFTPFDFRVPDEVYKLASSRATSARNARKSDFERLSNWSDDFDGGTVAGKNARWLNDADRLRRARLAALASGLSAAARAACLAMTRKSPAFISELIDSDRETIAQALRLATGKKISGEWVARFESKKAVRDYSYYMKQRINRGIALLPEGEEKENAKTALENWRFGDGDLGAILSDLSIACKIETPAIVLPSTLAAAAAPALAKLSHCTVLQVEPVRKSLVQIALDRAGVVARTEDREACGFVHGFNAICPMFPAPCPELETGRDSSPGRQWSLVPCDAIPQYVSRLPE